MGVQRTERESFNQGKKQVHRSVLQETTAFIAGWVPVPGIFTFLSFGANAAPLSPLHFSP